MMDAIPIARAEINRVGAGWDGPTRAEAVAPLALPLTVPGGLPEAVAPPPPPPPTEAELRERLSLARAFKHAATETLKRAEAAHQRAEVHRENCARSLANYAHLDAAIAEHTIQALRCDAGRLDPSLSDEAEVALAERDSLRAQLTAADTALSTFRRELAEASQRAGDAARDADRAAVKVLACTAERLAQKHADAVRETTRLFELLASFDRVTGTRGSSLPRSVRSVLVDALPDPRGNLMRKLDTSMWTTGIEQLLADPLAIIELE
jgi:hypothetical protein